MSVSQFAKFASERHQKRTRSRLAQFASDLGQPRYQSRFPEYDLASECANLNLNHPDDDPVLAYLEASALGMHSEAQRLLAAHPTTIKVLMEAYKDSVVPIAAVLRTDGV